MTSVTFVWAIILLIWVASIEKRITGIARLLAPNSPKMLQPTTPPMVLHDAYRDAPEPEGTDCEGFVLVSVTKDGRERIHNELTDLETAVAARAKRMADAKEYPSTHKNDGAFYIHRAKLVVGRRVEVRAD